MMDKTAEQIQYHLLYSAIACSTYSLRTPVTNMDAVTISCTVCFSFLNLSRRYRGHCSFFRPTSLIQQWHVHFPVFTSQQSQVRSVNVVLLPRMQGFHVNTSAIEYHSLTFQHGYFPSCTLTITCLTVKSTNTHGC